MAPAIEEEAVELEAMRKGDRSWHLCRIYLSTDAPATLSVIINSKNVAEEYDIARKDEVLSYLRFRSIPLQDGECSNVEEGEQVLAMNKDQSKHLFYDAVVEKVRRVKHSKRVYCRCTFEVKWLHSESQSEAVVLSSNFIMKLSRKSIDSHSVVAEFLNSLSSTRFTSNIDERTPETDVQGLPEYDIQGLLEKQIEEISRIADSPNKISMEEIIIDDSKDLTKITASKTRRNLRSSTRAQRINQLELDVKKQLDDASFLTPLAARAALASLMHELPNSSEFSDGPEKKEVSMNVPSSVRVAGQAISTNPFFQGFGARIPQDVSETKSNMLCRQNIARSLRHSEPKTNPDWRKPTRLTRSMGQKGNQDLTEEVERRSHGEDRKDHGEDRKVNMRLTRSMVEKGNGEQVEVPNKRRGKNKEPELSIGVKLSTHLGEEKNNFSPVSSVHQEPINKNLIQDIQLGEFAQGCERLVNTETNGKVGVPSSNNSDSSIMKGTKRTRSTNSTSNQRVNKDDIPSGNKSDSDKPENGSSKRPPLRFSPRLRLLQSNGSHK